MISGAKYNIMDIIYIYIVCLHQFTEIIKDILKNTKLV